MKGKLLFLLAGILLVACNQKPAEVLVLPTLHGAHEVNQNYSYEDLMQHIKAFSPDVIGIEVRPVDMDLPGDSLDQFYPQEMVQVRDSFPNIVTGIDFYSDETKDEIVNRKMFTDSTTQMGRIKRLSQQMKLDSLLVSRHEELGISKINDEQGRIALSYSAADFLKGEYDSLTQRQYWLEDSLFKNTVYEEYSRFNNQRDLEITKNALKLIENHPSKRVLILVGANHRNRLVDSLKNFSKNEVKLVESLDF